MDSGSTATGKYFFDAALVSGLPTQDTTHLAENLPAVSRPAGLL
jgi:hypothetical protein